MSNNIENKLIEHIYDLYKKGYFLGMNFENQEDCKNYMKYLFSKFIKELVKEEITEILGDVFLCKNCRKHNKDILNKLNLF